MTSSFWGRLVSGMKALTRGRKKPAPQRARPRWQPLWLETLETRLAPAVNASLTNGVLDIALGAAGDQASVLHPTGSIRVFDPVANQVVGDFNDTLVKSIDAHGSNLSGQAITFTDTIGLEQELRTSGLGDVTINGSYTAGSVELGATDSFTLASGGILSTRNVATGANPLTAPSLGDSGDLKIDAPAITISTGSSLLAGVEEGSAFKPGAIELTSEDTAIRQVTSFLPVFLTTKTAAITLDHATIDGGDIKIEATAADKNLYDDLGAYVDKLEQNAFGLLGQLPGMVSSLVTGIAAQVNVRASQASINATGSSITGSGVDISATALANASFHTVAVSSALNTGFTLAIGYGQAESTATVTLAGTTITSDGTVRIDSAATSEAEVKARGSANPFDALPSNSNAVAISLGVGNTRETSHVTVSQDSAITSKHGAIDIAADGEVQNFDVAAPTIYQDGAVGIGISLSIDKADIRAQVDGQLDAFGGSTVSFAPTGVSTSGDTITLPRLPFEENEAVVYHAPANGTAVGGLTDGDTYYVHLVDPSTNTIQLLSGLGMDLDHSEVNPASTHTLSRMASKSFDATAVDLTHNTIAITGFSEGQLVTYIGNSNDPTTNASRGIPGLKQGHQYKVHLAPEGKITLSDPAASNPTATVPLTGKGSGTQLFVYSDNVQSFMPSTAVDSTADTITLPDHGLNTGDAVIYAVDPNHPGAAQPFAFLTSDGQGGFTSQPPLGTVTDLDAPISGLENGRVYYVVTLDDNTIRLAPTRDAALAAAPVHLTSGASGTQSLQAADEADGIGIHAKLEATNMANTSASLSDEVLGFPALLQEGPVNADVLIAGIANLGAAIPGSVGGQLSNTPLSGASSPLSAAGAIALVFADHTVVADIGPTAQLKANNDVSIGAEINEFSQTIADAGASKPEGSNTVLGVAAAIGLGSYTNTAHAFVEGGAHIDAGNTVGVESAVNYPFLTDSPISLMNPVDYLKESGPEGWAFFFDSTLGLSAGLFNSFITSAASGAKVSAGGSFGITIANNESLARIGAGAQINQLTDTRFRTGEQSVDVKADTTMQIIEVAGAGGLGLNLEGGVDALENFAGGKVIDGINQLTNPFGAEGDKGAIGASLLLNVTTNNTQATIEDGAAIYTGPALLKPEEERGLKVEATQDIFDFAFAEAGSSASAFAVAGSIDVGVLTTTTVANVGSGAEVDGEALRVLSDDNLERISVAGSVLSGEAVGLGVSVGVNVINRDTEAYLGNHRDQTPGTAGTSVHLEGPLEIAARSSGQLRAFSLAGLFMDTVKVPVSPVAQPEFTGPPLPSSPETPAPIGVGLAGAVGINLVTETTAAYVNDDATVDVHEVMVTSDDSTRMISATGGLALAVQPKTTVSAMFAGALSVNTLTLTTLSFIDGAELKVRTDPGEADDKLTVTATREGDLIAAAAGIGGQVAGGSSVTVAGSVSLNTITTDTEAYLRDVNVTRVLGSNEFDVEGSTSLDASDTSAILAIGGGLAITVTAGGSSPLALTIGVAGAGNTIDSTVKAFLDHSALVNEGNVEVTADSAPSISAYTFAGALTAQVSGGGGFSGTGAGAGSINDITSTVAAVIEGSSNVTAGGSLGLTATDAPSITANAGGFGLALTTGGNAVDVAIGASFAENQITGDVRAAIDASTAVAGTSIDVSASTDGAAIHALTIGASLDPDVGQRAGVLLSGAGAVSDNIIHNTVEALVEGGSSVTTTNGDVSLSATDNSTIAAQAWGFGFGLTVGQNVAVTMGFGITLNTIGNEIRSEVDGATVSAGTGVALEATSTPTITSLEVAAAISANFNSAKPSAAVAAAGAGGKNAISNTVESVIEGASSVTSHQGGAVEIKATDDASITASATAVAVAASTSVSFAASVALSGTYAENVVTDHVRASIDGATINSAGAVDVTATSTCTIDAELTAVSASLAAAASLISVAISAASSTATNTVDGDTTASIQGAGSVTAAGDIQVEAENTETKLTSDVTSVAVSVGTIGVAIGVSLAENTIGDDVTAYIDSSATSTGGKVHVGADSTSDVDRTHAVAVGVSLSGFSGSGGDAEADVSGTTEAYLGSNANVTAAQGTVEVSSTSASTAHANTEGGGGSIGVNASVFLAEASIGRATLAHVDEGATVKAGALTVQADATSMDAEATETFGSAGLVLGAGVAETTTTVNGAVEAYIGNKEGVASNGLTTLIDVTNAVTVHASTDQATATSAPKGGSGSILLSAAAMIAHATVDGATKAYLGYLGDPASGAHLNSGGLDAEATDGGSSAKANLRVVNVALGVGGAGGGADAEVTRDVKAYIAPNDVVDAGGGQVTVKATSDATATADATGDAGGGAASVAALTVSSHVGGTTSAYVGAGAKIIDAGALEVTADALQGTANATSEIVNVSLGLSGSGSSTTATADREVDSFIGNGATIDTGGTVTVHAVDQNKAGASAETVSVGLALNVGVVLSSATAGGQVNAYVGSGAVVGSAAHPAAGLDVAAIGVSQSTSTTDLGGGGIFNGQDSSADANTSPNISAYLGDGASVNVTGAATVVATNTPRADATAFGVGVGALGDVTAAISNANVDGTTSSYLGNNATVSADSLTLDAQRTATTQSSSTAGSGSVLVGIDAAVSTAESAGTVKATTGTGVFLPDGDVTIKATSKSNQSADTTGVAVGGLLAIGVDVANANSNVTTLAQLGAGALTHVGRAGDLTVQATGTDTNDVASTAGSGGLLAGDAAIGNTNDTSTVSAGLGGALTPGMIPAIYAGTVAVHAVNNSVFTADVDSVNAALVGASGAKANNNARTEADATVQSNTAILATFAVNVTAQNTFTETLPSDGNTVSAGAGGFLNGTAAESITTLTGNANVTIGSGVLIDVETPGTTTTGTPGIFLVAASALTTSDTVTLSSGGAIEGAGTTSSLTATLNNNVTTNSSAAAPDNFTTNRNIGIGTYTTVDSLTTSLAHTFGALGALAIANANTEVTSNQSVTLGPSTNLTALDNIKLIAGDNPIPGQPAAQPLLAASNGQSFARGFIGIPSASATTNLISNTALTVGTGDQIKSGENTILSADPGTPLATATGIAHGYELFFIPATGGSSTATNPTSSTVTVNGSVTAGAYHELDITIPDDGSAGSGYSSTVRVNPDGADHAAFASHFQYFNPFTTIQNAAANGAFSSPGVVSALEKGVYNGPVGAMVLGPLFAAGGDVRVNAGTLRGSGTLAAYGGPTISITNHSPDYLVLGSINIPNEPGGHVVYTGTAITPPSSLTVIQSGSDAQPLVRIQQLYNQPVPALNNSGPSVFLTAVSDNQGNITLNPNGTVNNQGGQVAITVADGSLVEVGSLNALQVNISVLKGVYAVSNPFGLTSTGASPSLGWDTAMFWPGAVNPYKESELPKTLVNTYAAYVANAMFNADGLFSALPAPDLFFNMFLLGHAGATPLSSHPGNGFPGSRSEKQPATSLVFLGADAPWLEGAPPLQDSNESASALSPIGGFYTISDSANDGNANDDHEGIFPLIPVERLPITTASHDKQTGGTSTINAGAVYINAKYVDVDGTVNVGQPNNRSLSLPASLNSTIAQYQALYANGIYSTTAGDAPGFYTLPAGAIASGDTPINAQFDALTNQIIVSNVSAATGGFIALDGVIMNTNALGQINVNSDLGQVKINNQTNYPIVVKNVSASNSTTSPWLSGVDIIDRFYDTPTHTLYVYQPDNTIAVYAGTADQSVQQLQQGPPVQVISGQEASYSPASGLRWQWQLQTTIQQPGNIFHPFTPGTVSTAGWAFDTQGVENPGDENHPGGLQNLDQNPWYYLKVQDGDINDGTTTPTGWTVLAPELHDYDFEETISGTVTGFRQLTVHYHDGHFGFAPTNPPFSDSRGEVDPWTYIYATRAELTLTNSVKADNPIGINFAGPTQATVTITSSTPVTLEGNIANPLGDTTISAPSITQDSSATITSNTLTLDTGLAGNVGTASQPVSASLTENGVLKVQAGSGGVYLDLDSGAVLHQVNASNGDVVVNATGSLVAGSETSIQGNSITLTSTEGAVGTAAAPLLIVPSGVVNAAALQDIGLTTFGAVLKVGEICSTTGDVTLAVPLGSIVNGNDPAVIAFQNEVNAAYAAYWQLLNSGVVQNGTFTLNAQAVPLYSPAAADALNVPNPTSAQVQSYANTQYQDYVAFFNQVFGSSWMGLPQFQTDDPSFHYMATSQQVANLGTNGAYWALLKDPLAQVALNPSAGTPVGIITDNICGHNVNLVAGNGNIGKTGAPTDIALADLQSGNLTAAQQVALADATTTADIVYTYSNGQVTGVRVSPTVQVFVSATGTLNASATGSITIQSTSPDITLGQVTAGGATNITAPDSILSSGSGTQITTPGDTVLKAATGTVGAPLTPMVVSVGGQLHVYTPPGNAYLAGDYNLNIPTDLVITPSIAGPLTYGQSVTLTATIADTVGTGVPTGRVEFYEGTTDLGPGTALQGSGNSATSTFTISNLAVGAYPSIIAVYIPTGQFEGSWGSVNLMVNRAPLTISAVNESKTYGTTFTPDGTTQFIVSGLLNGDSVASVALASSGYAATATVASPGPNYAITPSAAVGSGLDNYTINYVAGALTVTKATLTVTADNASRFYGVENPTFTASYSGFQNGEILATSEVTGAPGLTTTATASSVPGTYQISAGVGTLAAANYTFSLATGTLTVNPAPLSASGVNFSATAGAPFSGTVATFTNADPFGSAASYSATITWGDGSTSAGVISGTGSTLTVSGSHTYADPVNETISVQISHNLGYTTTANVSATATVTSLGLGVVSGQTGTIGFWRNSNGQALISSFNGGQNSTALSAWLAATFPNLYGAGAGANNLSGKTNSQVAAFYMRQFNLGAPKAEAQVLAAALSIYATTSSLGGTAGVSYGFTVSATGLGARSYSVGAAGEAFGVENNTTRNIYQLLLAVNKKAVKGVLYNGDATLRSECADLLGALNLAGDIG
jgi:hypothetical protein